MRKGFTKHTWRAPAGYRFEFAISHSSYLVEIYKGDQLIEHSGRDGRRPQWGAALTDSLSSSCYTGNPERARSAIGFLFNRIDKGFEGDRTLYSDLFAAAVYVGETGKQRNERWQRFRDAERRARDLRFTGRWSEANAEAKRIKAELEIEDADFAAKREAAASGADLARVVITAPSGETTFGPYVAPERAADDAAALARMFAARGWKHRVEHWRDDTAEAA